MLRAVIVLVGLLPPLQAVAATWEPAKTWVFAVGVLQFDSPHLQTYPEEGRVDALLVETLIQRGVPKSQIVFLKNEQATRQRVQDEFASLLQQTREDDTLVFYYTGHGSRDLSQSSRPVNFITYDTAARWTCGDIFDAIEANFQGKTAILIADCCHSGGLAEEAARRSKKTSYAVLASAQPASVSTSNWTFTQCIVDVFTGKSVVDANRDGEIHFEEAGQYGDAEMCFCEEQRACHAVFGGVSTSLVLATTDKKNPHWLGKHCETPANGVWMKGKVIESKDGMYLIDWVGRPRKKDEWRLPEQLREPDVAAMEAGQRVQVEWNNTWYAGKILQTHRGLHLVHYDGYPSQDDEWVPLRRLRPQP